MKTNLRTNTIALISFLLCSISLTAQDIHWSQFNNSPLNLSPALTGVHRGDIRFAGSYRNQWQNVPVDYLTFSAAVDMKFLNKGNGNGYFAGGLLFDYDQAGDGELSWTKFGLSGSYTQQINKKNLLTAGIQASVNQRAFKPGNLQFDNQYSPEGFYDPTRGTGETFKDPSLGFADFSAGLNYRFQNPKTRTRLNLGGALFHINRPKISFYDEDNKQLTSRVSAYGQGIFQLKDKFDLVLQALGQWQTPHREIVLGIAGKIHLNTNWDKELALQLGLDLRLKDAIIPHAELHYRQWLFGLSYDVNFSNFNITNSSRGGPEIHVIHILTRVKPPEFKICPIY